MVDVHRRFGPRRRPHAGHRKSTVLQLLRPLPSRVDLGRVQRVVLGEEGIAVLVVVGDGVHGDQNVARYWEAARRT